jgi:hypothetical protein
VVPGHVAAAVAASAGPSGTLDRHLDTVAMAGASSDGGGSQRGEPLLADSAGQPTTASGVCGGDRLIARLPQACLDPLPVPGGQVGAGATGRGRRPWARTVLCEPATGAATPTRPRRRYQGKISMPSARRSASLLHTGELPCRVTGARAGRGIYGVGGAVATVRESIVVNRPCAGTFAYLADPTRRHEWQPQVARTEMLGEGEVGAGTQAVEVRRMFGREVRVPFEITRHEPPSRQDSRTTGGPVRPGRDPAMRAAK